MFSERDASMVTEFRLSVNGKDLGRCKSSGILISTGTGSTGWLYQARAVSAQTVHQFKKIIGIAKHNQLDLIDYDISKVLSDKTIFPEDKNLMYYFVREGFQETFISEGFCQDLIITAETLEGEVKGDGCKILDIDIGDEICLSVDPKYALKCLKLIY